MLVAFDNVSRGYFFFIYRMSVRGFVNFPKNAIAVSANEINEKKKTRGIFEFEIVCDESTSYAK